LALLFFKCKMLFLFFESKGKFDKSQSVQLLPLDLRTE
jgi:hypothetical protein